MKILIENIVESPFQRRKEYDNMEGLAQSIRHSGLINPITVRTIEGETGYELVAGHRRFRATKDILEWTEIECSVQELTDQAAKEIVYAENAQREDIHPMEEAELLEDLLGTNKNLDHAAGVLGKSKRGLGRLLALLNLSAHARKLFSANIITSGHAIILSSINKKAQKALLQGSIEDGRCTESVKDWKWWIKFNLHVELEDAAFDLEDTVLNKGMGACTRCKFNSSHGDYLFDDVYPEGVCTKPKCFHGKQDKFMGAAWKEFIAKYPEGKPMYKAYGSNTETYESRDVITSHGYEICEEGDKGAFPVFFIGGYSDTPVGESGFVKKESNSSYSSRPEIPEDETKIEAMERKLPRRWELREYKSHFATREWMAEEICKSEEGLTQTELNQIVCAMFRQKASNTNFVMKLYGEDFEKYKHGRWDHYASENTLNTIGVSNELELLIFLRAIIASDNLVHGDKKRLYWDGNLGDVAKELKTKPAPEFKKFNKEHEEKKKAEQAKLEDMQEKENSIKTELHSWTASYCMGYYDDIPPIVLTALRSFGNWKGWEILAKFCRKLKVPTNGDMMAELEKHRIPIIVSAAQEVLLSSNPNNEDNLKNILGDDLQAVRNELETEALPVGDNGSEEVGVGTEEVASEAAEMDN